MAARVEELDTEEARAEFLRCVTRIVANRAAKRGFVLILDASTKRGSPLIHASDSVPDLTDEVLQALLRANETSGEPD